MKKVIQAAGIFLLIAVLVFSLAACGQRASQPEEVTETKEIVLETPPASPTPSPTPTPSVPPVAVTTVPMPMPSVSPTVAVTTTPDPEDPDASPAASPTVQPSPSAAPSPTPTPYSYDAEFASTIQPDGVNIPDKWTTTYYQSVSAFANQLKIHSGGICVGEAVGFKSRLTTAERDFVSAVLMKKWFGTGTPAWTTTARRTARSPSIPPPTASPLTAV